MRHLLFHLQMCKVSQSAKRKLYVDSGMWDLRRLAPKTLHQSGQKGSGQQCEGYFREMADFSGLI